MWKSVLREGVVQGLASVVAGKVTVVVDAGLDRAAELFGYRRDDDEPVGAVGCEVDDDDDE